MRLGSLVWIVDLLLLVRLLKVGLPPFHRWVLHIFSYLNKRGFLFITTVHKIAPVLLLIKLFFSSFFLAIVSFAILFGRISFMLLMSRLLGILAFSSMIHTGWMVFRAFCGLSLYVLYWVLYFFLILGLLRGISIRKNILDAGASQSRITRGCWLALSGIPPFLVFWLKVSILGTLLLIRVPVTLLLICILTLSIIGYFRVFSLRKLTMSPVQGRALPSTTTAATVFLC